MSSEAEQFDAALAALSGAQDAFNAAFAAHDRAETAALSLATAPPFYGRISEALPVPHHPAHLDDAEFARGCLLARLSAEETEISRQAFAAFRAALRRAECDLGLPKLDAARRRRSVELEAAWAAFLACPAPDLARVIRKLENIAPSTGEPARVESVLYDLQRLQEDSGHCQRG